MESSPEYSDEIVDLLTAYALDALEPAERAKVQQLLSERPELQKILAELRAAADLLPFALERPVLPPEWRQRTIDYALGRQRIESKQKHSFPHLRQPWLIGLGSLATALIIAVFGLIGYINNLHSQLTTAIQQRDQAQALAATAQAASQQLAAVLTNPTPLASLRGDAGQGSIYLDRTGELLLIAALPPLTENQVYQLWVIEENAAPVSGGVFTIDTSGYGIIRLPAARVPDGSTLAITAEPSPGSDGPTGPILIAGKIT